MIPLNLPSTPFKIPESTNVFLLTGSPLTLVDTGYKTDTAWEALNNQLVHHGYEIGDLKQVLLTHAHPDHYGMAARISANADVEILAHRDSATNLQRNSKSHQEGNNFLFETLRKTGAPEEHLVKWLAPRKKGLSPAESITVSKIVRNGEVVSNGDETWTVMDMPGHAPGVIGLYCSEKVELIVSDHLLADTNSRPGLYQNPITGERDSRFMGEYINTLERLKQMNLNVAWTSHGDPINDVSELVSYWLDRHKSRACEIADPIKEGDKTAYQLWKAHFPKILPFDPITGLIEIITYLDLEIFIGTVQTYTKDGLIHYRSV